MLRRFLSCRSRPDPDLIRENILNSNGEREKKGSPFSLFLPSLSDRRNYLHDLSKNISKLIKIREFIKECQILPLLSFDKLFIREKKRCLIHQLDSKSYPNTFLFDLVFLKRSLATNHITFSISRHCIDKIGKRTKTKLQK